MKRPIFRFRRGNEYPKGYHGPTNGGFSCCVKELRKGDQFIAWGPTNYAGYAPYMYTVYANPEYRNNRGWLVLVYLSYSPDIGPAWPIDWERGPDTLPPHALAVQRSVGYSELFNYVEDEGPRPIHMCHTGGAYETEYLEWIYARQKETA